MATFRLLADITAAFSLKLDWLRQVHFLLLSALLLVSLIVAFRVVRMRESLHRVEVMRMHQLHLGRPAMLLIILRLLLQRQMDEALVVVIAHAGLFLVQWCPDLIILIRLQLLVLGRKAAGDDLFERGRGQRILPDHHNIVRIHIVLCGQCWGKLIRLLVLLVIVVVVILRIFLAGLSSLFVLFHGLGDRLE